MSLSKPAEYGTQESSRLRSAGRTACLLPKPAAPAELFCSARWPSGGGARRALPSANSSQRRSPRRTPWRAWCAPAPRSRQQDAVLCGMRRAPRCLRTLSAGPAQVDDARAAVLALLAIKAAPPEPGLAELLAGSALGAVGASSSGPAKRKRGEDEVRRCLPLRGPPFAAGAGHARSAARRRRQFSCARAVAGPVLCRAQASCDSRSRARACREGVAALRAQWAAWPRLTPRARRGAERAAARQAGGQAPARLPPGAARAGARTRWRRAA